MELLNIKADAEKGLIVFDYENTKKQLLEFLSKYKDYKLITSQESRKDRAFLNKFRNAVDGKRIEVKKEILSIYNKTFEPQMEELVGIIDEVIENIDNQIHKEEQTIKDVRYNNINYWAREALNNHLPGITINEDLFFNGRWAMANVALSTVKTEVEERAMLIKNTIQMFRDINKGYLIPNYLLTLKPDRVIDAEKKITDKRKEMNLTQTADKTVLVRLIGSENQLKEIGDWLRDNGYHFNQVGEIEKYD